MNTISANFVQSKTYLLCLKSHSLPHDWVYCCSANYCVFTVPELSGYKEKFEFKEIKTGQSIFLTFPNDLNITHITVNITGNISEDVVFLIGGNIMTFRLKKNGNIDTTYEGDCYGNEVELRTICYKKGTGTL